ncbi:RHS repeat-associated core domain-containing protein, partial [Streptomyces sp. NRRL F-2664]|uniref:RHS repeat-associated core domain-containing protein n=1 Tax=Streptomyces sp. NRRL F-2664 TaxID=1463842 RepID=UPI0005B93A5B
TAHETDSAGRLTAVVADGGKTEQSWDAAGNLLKGADGTAWTYSPDNKPLTAATKDGVRTEYTYWADGSRRSSTTTGPDGATSAVTFHYTPGGAIANDTHTTPDGNARSGSYLTGAAGREARSLTATPGAARYLHTDRRGNTILETGSEGGIHTSRAYTDYGQETGPGAAPAPAAHRAADPAANPFRFGGEYTNEETGTQYSPARLYHPETGRFTTRDPHPTPLNKYQAYAANPVEHTDPTGNFPISVKFRTKLQKSKAKNRKSQERRPQMSESARKAHHRDTMLRMARDGFYWADDYETAESVKKARGDKFYRDHIRGNIAAYEALAEEVAGAMRERAEHLTVPLSSAEAVLGITDGRITTIGEADAFISFAGLKEVYGGGNHAYDLLVDSFADYSTRHQAAVEWYAQTQAWMEENPSSIRVDVKHGTKAMVASYLLTAVDVVARNHADSPVEVDFSALRSRVEGVYAEHRSALERRHLTSVPMTFHLNGVTVWGNMVRK